MEYSPIAFNPYRAESQLSDLATANTEIEGLKKKLGLAEASIQEMDKEIGRLVTRETINLNVSSLKLFLTV
jgi:hypothetical protein